MLGTSLSTANIDFQFIFFFLDEVLYFDFYHHYSELSRWKTLWKSKVLYLCRWGPTTREVLLHNMKNDQFAAIKALKTFTFVFAKFS